jgi:hypothetical protein
MFSRPSGSSFTNPDCELIWDPYEQVDPYNLAEKLSVNYSLRFPENPSGFKKKCITPST